VAALRLNSTPVITCYHPFILYLQTFFGASDYILNENIIILYYLNRNLFSAAAFNVKSYCVQFCLNVIRSSVNMFLYCQPGLDDCHMYTDRDSNNCVLSIFYQSGVAICWWPYTNLAMQHIFMSCGFTQSLDK